MDAVTISELLSVEDIGTNDVLPIVNGGNTKKISIDQLGDVFSTKDYVVNKIQEAIAAATGDFSFTPIVVQTLPTQDIDEHTIYLVPKTGETGDIYDEYIYINNAWEHIGSTSVDLSNYLAKNNTTSFTPSGDYNPATKKYVDDAVGSVSSDIQYTTMPTASADNLGKVVQYIGTTTSSYTKGFFYTCTSQVESNVTTYSWQPISVENDEIQKITSENIYINTLPNGLYLIGSGINANTNVYQKSTSTNSLTIVGYGILLVNEYRTRKTGLVFQRCFIHDVELSNTIYTLDLSTVLHNNNTTVYTPVNDYNPATKKYVDDSITNKIWIGTQTEYDNLPSYSETTLYFIKEDVNVSA